MNTNNSLDVRPEVPPVHPVTAMFAGVLEILRQAGWALWVVSAFLLLAVVGPLIAPHDPFSFDVPSALRPPSLAHPLGTDQYGRDFLSRMMVGSRTLVAVSGTATLAALAIGVTWGLLGAYFGGIGDESG